MEHSAVGLSSLQTLSIETQLAAIDKTALAHIPDAFRHHVILRDLVYPRIS